MSRWLMNWRHLSSQSDFNARFVGCSKSLSLNSFTDAFSLIMEIPSVMTTTELDGITIISLLNKTKQSWNSPADADLHKHCISFSALFLCLFWRSAALRCAHAPQKQNETKQTCAVYWWLIIWVKVIVFAFFCFVFHCCSPPSVKEWCALLAVCKTLSRNKLKPLSYSRNAAVVVKCTCAAFFLHTETLTATMSSIST